MTTNKVCGKGKCKFTDEFCASGDCPYDRDNVAQRNSQDLERVADTSKTIDHIADVSKKVSLTEHWKKGELKTGWYYVSRNKDIEMLEYVGDYFLSGDVPLIDDKDVSTLEVLAPVPSYDEWRSLQSSWVDEMDRATRFQKALEDVCDEYNQRLPILEAENQQLKELLKECKSSVLFEADVVKETSGKHSKDYKMLASILTKIDEVLK